MPQGENGAVLTIYLTLGIVQVGKTLWSFLSPLLFGAGLRSKLLKFFSALSSSETLQGRNSCCLFGQPLLVLHLSEGRAGTTSLEHAGGIQKGSHGPGRNLRCELEQVSLLLSFGLTVVLVSLIFLHKYFEIHM